MSSHSLINKKNTFVFISFIAIFLVLAVTSLLLTRQKTEALSASDFSAGRIIDDSVFYNKDAMNAQQIQDFLNKLIPNCDTWGANKSGYGNLTNAQYAQQIQGWPAPPYVCLNNYYENPTTGETSFEKGGSSFNGGLSAAQIIYNASQQYGINPQVLLVMLKKESPGPLTSDSWSLKSQYKYAMGYGCPDSGPGYSANCDSAQSGFYKQMMKAAWQLNYYKNHINDYRYKLGVNKIQYTTDPNCGTKSVNIENIATLSLYIYTPYTPNDASLANYPGTSSCGSYGNRNFFMYFKEWFGSPNYKAPNCDSKLSNVSCVWRLYNPDNVTDFLTVNNQERDAAVLNSRYSYENISFYAFTVQQSGTIPVYRIKMADRYFYTASATEKNTLIQGNSNTLEGIAFYVYPPDAADNSSYPVYRLNGTRGHLLTTSATERDALIASGYTDEGIAFNAPSSITTEKAPTIGKSNIYRLNSGKEHMYTTNLSERDSLLRSEWKYEGILSLAPAANTGTPVYRLYNNQEHFYTASIEERNALVKNNWSYEGIAWYVDSKTPPIYRFYTNGEHFYTSDLNEAAALTNRNAIYEGVAFGSNQTNSIPIYRLYNGSDHFYTANVSEVLSIANNGWQYEGIAWQSISGGTPVYRLSMGSNHFFTSNTTEKDTLIKGGWLYEGIGWQTAGDNPVYRLVQGPYHFYTTNMQERDNLVGSSWRYEGISW